MESNTILSVKDLCIGYRKSKNEVVRVVDGIKFSLNSGELTAIIGMNGIGKSTLLKTLGNVQPRLSGSIALKGKPLAFYGQSVLAQHISIVLTDTVAAKNITVWELIALGRQPYTNWIGNLSETDRNKIQEAVSLLELEQLQHKKCYELSDGELQRVMIARALAQDTEIILLDEPTTHLDLHHKVQILKLLQRITRETRKSVLFTSHEIELAIQLCDNLLVIKTGGAFFGTPNHLIEQGTFDKLFPENVVTFNSETRTFKINT